MRQRTLPLLLLAMLLLTAACSRPAAQPTPPILPEPAAAGAPAAPVQAAPPSAAVAIPAGCEPAAPVTQWLSDRAIPLKSVTAGAGFDDLARLKPALKGVRVVGLGEATHGSREFFTMKHRMLEFLVSEMGYTLFGIEAPYPETLALNDYVLGREGNARQLVRGMGFWTWATQEVVDQVEWMRAYNKTVPPEKQVRFLGFDTQSIGGARPVSAYLNKVAPGTPKETLTILDTLTIRGMKDLTANTGDTPETEAQAAALQAVIRDLEANRDAYVAASSAEEYQVAVNLARNLARTHEAFTGPGDFAEKSKRRDIAMSQTVLDLLEQAGPDTKMVLWAHNMHVADAAPWMGSHLRKALGSQYYAIGFAFDHGQLNAIDSWPTGGRLTQMEAGPPKSGHLDWHFACTGLGNALVDYRLGEQPAAVKTWLGTEIGARVIGAVFNPEKPEETEAKIHPGAWDAMIYVPVIHAATRI